MSDEIDEFMTRWFMNVCKTGDKEGDFIARNFRATLLIAGFVIVPSTEALLRKGEESGVQSHD